MKARLHRDRALLVLLLFSVCRRVLFGGKLSTTSSTASLCLLGEGAKTITDLSRSRERGPIRTMVARSLRAAGGHERVHPLNMELEKKGRDRGGAYEFRAERCWSEGPSGILRRCVSFMGSVCNGIVRCLRRYSVLTRSSCSAPWPMKVAHILIRATSK